MRWRRHERCLSCARSCSTQTCAQPSQPGTRTSRWVSNWGKKSDCEIVFLTWSKKSVGISWIRPIFVNCEWIVFFILNMLLKFKVLRNVPSFQAFYWYVWAHLGHVHGQELLGRDDKVLRGGSDDDLGIDRFEGDVKVRRELWMKVLQHQVSGNGARVADPSVCNLLKLSFNQLMVIYVKKNFRFKPAQIVQYKWRHLI